MYTIFVNDNGTCSCHGSLQDGTEKWEAANLTAAVQSMKDFAKTMNGAKIKKRRDITYLKPTLETRVVWTEFKPFGEK